MSVPYRIALVLTRKPYRIGILFTNKDDYFASVSLTVQLQNCAAPILKVNRYISDRFPRHSLWQCEEAQETIRYSEDLGRYMI